LVKGSIIGHRGPLQEVLFSVLVPGPLSATFGLQKSKIDPADLAANGLGQFGELETTNPLVRREMFATVTQDIAR
jgi:hypothetical protein